MAATNDKQLYLEATQEVDSGTQDAALWAKAMALTEGDEEKARYRYITLRVEERSKASASAPPEGPAPITDSSDDKSRSTPDNSQEQLSTDKGVPPVINPDDAKAHYKLVAKLGRHGEAIAAYKTAIKLKPDYVAAYNNLGANLGELGRHAKAITAFKTAIKINPDDATAYNVLGAALGEIGRYTEAIAAFETAVRLDPDSPMVPFAAKHLARLRQR